MGILFCHNYRLLQVTRIACSKQYGHILGIVSASVVLHFYIHWI